MDWDSHDEVAVGDSGFRAGASTDAPALRQDPAPTTRAEAPRRRWRWVNGQWRSRPCALGPPTGGHDCPASADPAVTMRNRKKKARKAASFERYLQGLETMDKDAAIQDATDRVYDRFYQHHLQQLRDVASQASGSAGGY